MNGPGQEESGMGAFIAANLLNLWLLERSASTFVGRTISAGSSPGVGSGTEMVFQEVAVAVEEVICGPAPETSPLTLPIPIVEGARSAGDGPELARWITDPGSRVVYLREVSGTFDEDLGIHPATPNLVELLRTGCQGLPPPGLAAVVYLFAEGAETSPEALRELSSIQPVVLEFVDDQERVRLTISGNRLRVFSGVRRDRVARNRAPDHVLPLDAQASAAILTGRTGPTPQGALAAGVLRTLSRAGRTLAKDSGWRARIEAAAQGK